jgi:hypothetical protein
MDSATGRTTPCIAVARRIETGLRLIGSAVPLVVIRSPNAKPVPANKSVDRVEG